MPYKAFAWLCPLKSTEKTTHVLYSQNGLHAIVLNCSQCLLQEYPKDGPKTHKTVCSAEDRRRAGEPRQCSVLLAKESSTECCPKPFYLELKQDTSFQTCDFYACLLFTNFSVYAVSPEHQNVKLQSCKIFIEVKQSWWHPMT